MSNSRLIINNSYQHESQLPNIDSSLHCHMFSTLRSWALIQRNLSGSRILNKLCCHSYAGQNALACTTVKSLWHLKWPVLESSLALQIAVVCCLSQTSGRRLRWLCKIMEAAERSRPRLRQIAILKTYDELPTTFYLWLASLNVGVSDNQCLGLGLCDTYWLQNACLLVFKKSYFFSICFCSHQESNMSTISNGLFFVKFHIHFKCLNVSVNGDNKRKLLQPSRAAS